MDYYAITIKNDSKIIDDAEVYILGKGQNPDDNRGKVGGVQYSMIESYLKFDPATGEASFVRVDQAKSSEDYSIPLSSLPQSNGGATLKIPKTIGGRVYMSFKYKLDLKKEVGYKDQTTPDTLSIAEPDPFDQSDPNYAKIYDKVEFTYNDDGIWIDTTAVDFFCMPLKLAAGGESVGLTQTRKVILDTLKKAFTAAGGDWPNLVLSFKNAVLRVVAPNKAIGRTTGNFDESYLSPYLAAVWKYYEKGSLQIDASEIVKTGNPIFTGKVSAGTPGLLRFTNGDLTVDVGPPIPTSNEVFGCDQGYMAAQPGKAQSVIVRDLGAALNVGALPIAGSPVLSKAWFLSHDPYTTDIAHPDDYTAPKGGPWRNEYAYALHSFGEKVYAFAYDDAVGQDSTLHPPNPASNPSVVTIGDMTGTTIPDLADSTIYTVTFEVADGCSGSYTNPQDGKTYALKSKDTVVATNVKAPIVYSYDTGSGAQTYTVNIVPPSSQPQGVSVDASGSPAVTLTLPGKPATNKVQTQTKDHKYDVTLTAGSHCKGTYGGKTFANGTGAGSATVKGESASFQFGYNFAGAMTTYQVNIETGVITPSLGIVVLQTDPKNAKSVNVNLPGK